MGYYTVFELSCDNVELEEEIFDKIESISGGYDLRESEQYKWYDYKEDMVKLSKLFPTTLFTLNGEGEESGDIWKQYFKNGKSQLCKSVITFDKFDEIKLK